MTGVSLQSVKASSSASTHSNSVRTYRIWSPPPKKTPVDAATCAATSALSALPGV